MTRFTPAALAVLLLAGCATMPAAPTTPAATVTARGETVPVGTADADAADDPAIWRNAANPAASLIVATDKKAGLYVYGLDGQRRSYTQVGLVNNVDLRDGVAIGAAAGVLVAASNRTDLTTAAVSIFRLDTTSGALVPLGSVPAGAGEAYGFCLGRVAGATYGFVVMKDGAVVQVALDLSGPAPRGSIVRRLKLGTQSEGCVVDDRTGTLFVGEEDVGIWRFDARPTGDTAGTPFARIDGQTLVADVEGLAIAPEGSSGGYLVASSQGDNAYTLFRLADGSHAGRFRIAAGRFGTTSDTDGIELALGDFGPEYPGGLFVAQDGDNRPAAQNFKLVAWDDIRRSALETPLP